MTEPGLHTFGGDTPEAAHVMAIVEMWRMTLARALRSSGGDEDPNSLSMAMTAAAVMGGTYFGNAWAAGLVKDQDRRRAAESFARNFRQGIEIGKNQGERIAATMPVEGNA